MNVLIVFQSIEGQTAKIARYLEKEVRKAGHEVALLDTGNVRESLSLGEFDKIILAAPVHERRHPKEFETLLTASRASLNASDTLLLSVSLSAAFQEGLEDAQDYLTELTMRTGFTPDAEMLVAGAVRTSRYDYFASQVVRHVVLRGRDVDPMDKEHEFTDWETLKSNVAVFLDMASTS